MPERIFDWKVDQEVLRNGVIVGGIITVTFDGPRPRTTVPVFYLYPPESGVRCVVDDADLTLERLTTVLDLMDDHGSIHSRQTSYLLQQMRNHLCLAYQERILNKLKAQFDRINNRGMVDPEYLNMLAQIIGLLMSELNSYPNAPSDGSVTTQSNTQKDLAELDRLIRIFANAHQFFPEMLEEPPRE